MIVESIQSLVIGAKRNRKGWLNFNCPCCVLNGQSRPDTRKRGGLWIHSDGFQFKCFNCRSKASWFPGRKLNQKVIELMKLLGASDDLIGKCVLYAMKLIESGVQTETHFDQLHELKSFKLPESAKPLSYYAEHEPNNPSFLQAVNYINDRNPDLFDLIDFHYSPDPELKDRIIIPFTYGGEIHGYTARWCSPKKTTAKYLSSTESGFLMNADVLNEPHRKIVFVFEGCLDALPVQGVALLKAEGSDRQVKWLNEYPGIRKIVVPDRDKAGYGLIDLALQNGWSVSFPEFMQTCDFKDIEPAVARFGRLFVMQQMLKYEETSPLMIQLKGKTWCAKRNGGLK